MTDDRDRAREIADRRTRSRRWMEDNFYSQWKTAFKNYKAERDAEKDPDGQSDLTQTSIGMPDTWAITRRGVARTTAQIPNLRFHAKDPAVSELISRTLMYQWDKGGVQRNQKRHVLQAFLFGWSVRPWYFSVDEHTRSKRVDPMRGDLDEATVEQIAQTYKLRPEELLDETVRAELLAEHSRGRLLPVKYKYLAYQGPRCDFLFVGDCYPEPNFLTIQSSGWFIVERRRSREWIEKTVKRFPEFRAGFEELLKDKPEGTPEPVTRQGTADLREMFHSAIDRKQWTDETTSTDKTNPRWTILEQHVPGARPKLALVAEESTWIGEIDYPYDLDGKIAFTELVLIDDLLCGIGDSVPRIIRGLQLLHERQVNVRFDLIYNLLRPLICTSNRELYENADKALKRHKGFRLVYMRGPGDIWMQSEQAALASAAAGLQDESSIMRLLQFASGESNMTMAANVDPQQARTATGARILAFNQDVLTKDLVDMFNQSSVQADAELMFLMNRSELPDAVEFDGSPYDRNYTAERDMLREQWMKAEPAHFQLDGEITAELGSTMADDDEAKVAKATNLFQAAMSRPDLFNLQKARDEFLIAMGKGRELKQWAAPPPPPPQPPEVKTSMTVSVKWEFLSEAERQQFLQRAGVEIAPPSAEVPPGPGLPALPPGTPPIAAQAFEASQGRSPFEEGMAQ